MKHSQDQGMIHATAVPVDQYYNATAPAVAAEPVGAHPLLANHVNEAGAREFLGRHRWPVGLQETFLANLKRVPIRFFICDDSGSMSAGDGHRILSNGQVTKLVGCTRWQELHDALKFHAELARAASAPTEFRLLNGAAPIRVGEADAQDNDRFHSFMSSLENFQGGGTPLCRHIREVIAQIRPLEAQLRANGQKACVVIATDGESSDGDIIQAMQPLRGLPVWVVVRLCTDEDRIVNYWNNIDSQLEVDMDVLDDLSGEAQEVNSNNSWLTYGEPIHRLREFGVLIKEIDMMDSNKLSLDQVRKVCAVMFYHLNSFGGKADDFPHPELDFDGFIAALDRENRRAGQVWNPVTHHASEWVQRAKIVAMAGKHCGPKCVIS